MTESMSPIRELERFESESKEILCQTSDGFMIPVRLVIAEECTTIADMIMSCHLQNATPLVFDNMTSKALNRVFTYCEYIVAYNASKNTSSAISEKKKKRWLKQYCDVPFEDMIETAFASEYLGVQSLTDLIARDIARRIKNKNTSEIRSAFGIKDDFTREEREKMERENRWCVVEPDMKHVSQMREKSGTL